MSKTTAKLTKYIVIPETIIVCRDALNIEGQQAIPFSTFVCKVLLNDVRYGGGEDEAYLRMAMMSLFAEVEPGDVVPMRGNEWEKLRDAARQPKFKGGGGYDPEMGWQILPYIAAIKNATDEPPLAAVPNDNTPAAPEAPKPEGAQ